LNLSFFRLAPRGAGSPLPRRPAASRAKGGGVARRLDGARSL